MRVSFRQLLQCIFFLLGVGTVAIGQVLPFHTYSTKDGLLSNRILTMMQDSRGYLWIGTAEGVSVFDGVTFRNYTPADGLAGSYVTSVIESKKLPGSMWIGTLDGGLCKFVHGTFKKINLDTPSTQIFSLMEDRNGILWCGTNDFVLQVRETTVTKFQSEVTLRGVTQIVEANDSLVAIMNRSMLFVFSRHTGLLRPIELGLSNGASFLGYYKDANGDLWIAASDSNICRLRGSVLLEKRRVGTGLTFPLVLDNDDELWFTGVFRIPHTQLAGGHFIHYATENGLPGDNVYPLLVDNENSIWFGSWDNGLVKLAEKDIVRFPSRIYDSKNAVIPDDRGRLWGLALDGVWEYWSDSSGSWHQTRHLIGPPSSPLLHGSSGTFAHGCLWIGCNDGTIKGYTLRASHPTLASSMTLSKTISFPHGSPKNNLLGVFADQDDLWCVFGKALEVVSIRGEPRVVRSIGSPPLPSNAFVNALLKDRDGNVWIGDYSLGLFLLKKNGGDDIPTHFTIKNGLPDNAIRSIVEDGDRRVWIGTRYGGLAIYQSGKFTTLSTKDGLLSNHIRSMACDSSGTMWLGTSHGPMFIKGRDFRQVGWNNELLGAQVSACGVHSKGFLWFATSNGLTVYQHSRHRLNTKAPPAYITSFIVNGQSLDVLSPVDLSYQQNNCIIDFVGISLRDESAVRYQYRLEGVDAKWGAPTTQRSVTFATLSPGTYSFEVKAINADGVASVVPAAISFTIHPPFWYRWWFIGGFGVALLAAFGSVVRYMSTQRLQRKVQSLEKEKAVQLERERTRERIARDLHDDVASTLGSIVIYSESLKRQMDNMGESAELAERIGSLSQEAQESIGDIVWSTSPTHDSLKELLTRITDVTSDMCSASGLRYEITMPPTFPDVILSNEVRKSLLLIFKEAMNNIVKHAGARFVRIAATLSLGELRITIADDGAGFSSEVHDGSPRGHGLRNMAKRAEEIGASFSLRSSPGRGTTIEILHKMT